MKKRTKGYGKMRKRTLFALLVTVLAVFTLALAVSAETITKDQPLVLDNGKIYYAFDIYATSLEIDGISYDAENGEWIIKDLDLTVCYKGDVLKGIGGSYSALLIKWNDKLVFEGENKITLDLDDNAYPYGYMDNFFPSVIAADRYQLESGKIACSPINIQGREVDGVKPTLKLVNKVIASNHYPPASIRSYNYIHTFYEFESNVKNVEPSSITVDGVSLETNAPMFCHGDITVKNCPKFEILYDEITATESDSGYILPGCNYIVATGTLTIESCPGFKLGLIDETLYGGGGICGCDDITIKDCGNFNINSKTSNSVGIYTFGDLLIENCPGFKVTGCNRAISLHNSELVEKRSVKIDNCDGFELNSLGGTGIIIEENVYEVKDDKCESAEITIKNSKDFRINANGLGINIMLSGAKKLKTCAITIDNCPGFTFADLYGNAIHYYAIATYEADGVKTGTVEIKNSEKFKIYGAITVNNTVTIDNCPDFLFEEKNNDYRQSAIEGRKGVTITSCPRFEINMPDNGNGGIETSGDLLIKDCPSFVINASSDWGEGIDVTNDGNLTVEGCPNFKINSGTDAIYVSGVVRAYGEGDQPKDYVPTKTQSVKIKDCEGFEITSESSLGIQAFMPSWSNNAAVEIENCKNFKINALSYGIYVQADVPKAVNSISIKDSEGFEISVSGDDWYSMNGICISSLWNAENCNNSITIENSEGFKVNSEKRDGINIMSYESNANNSVTIKDSAKFAITTYEFDGIAIASGSGASNNSADGEIAVYADENEGGADVYGDNTVTIENCPDFVIRSVYENEKGIHGGTNIGIYYNSEVTEDTVCGKASVRIADSDNFVLEGARNIQVYANVYTGNGSVQIDNCKNFSATSHAEQGIMVDGSYNVNASSGYVEALGDLYYHIPEGEEPYDYPESAVIAYKIGTDETVLITHTGETTADREVGVIYYEYDDIRVRQCTYKENADDESENFKMAPKVIYSLPEPEPEPEPEKKFTLPYLIEIRFDTNGGTKLRSAISTPGYSLGLARYIPEKAGYTFTGWYADKELTKPIKRIVAFENTTIYAGWTSAD